MQEDVNSENLRRFGERVAGLRLELPRRYDRSVNIDLARQNSQQLLLRNMVAVTRQAYAEAFEALRLLQFSRDGYEVSAGRSSLTAEALKAFEGFADSLLQYAVHKHRTTCALSNFPAEHTPSPDYMAEVVQAVAEQWREFALQVNTHLLDGGVEY